MAALLGVAASLAGVTGAMGAALMYLKKKSHGKPSTNQRLRVLKRATADWSIPYEELNFGRLLGKGSQGEVYQAEWRGTNVAVKKVDVRKVDPDIVEEFCQEAHIMKRLRHPCLTLFMGVSISYPYLCIVTEFVEKGSMFDMLREGNNDALTWQKCLQIAMDIAQGMTYLHEYQPAIIHRDLKSLNILISSTWRAKVADFGMTRFQNEGTMTQCGSPLWMAPEMIRNDPYDEKSDVYSFGICLWELYTRKIPYRGSGLNPSQLVVKVVKDELRPVVPRMCPAPYVRLMEMCWHPVPTRRPSFKQIIKSLETIMRDPTVTSHKPNCERGEEIIARPVSVDVAAPHPFENAKAGQRSWQVNFANELALESKIGQGRSATVFKGEFRGKGVAVKQWTVNLEAAEHRAQIEARVAEIMDRISQLRHPNIALFMGAYFERDHVGMLVEYMPRGTLHQLIHNPKVMLPWDTMLQFMIDAAQGLVYLHETNPPIYHGDLKSSRLLVDENWRVKISGYGIIDFDSTIQSVTPSAWTAPEVLENPAQGGGYSNVYSFGVIIWELVTRTYPYGTKEFTDKLAESIMRGFRPSIPDSMPPGFRALINAALHPDPKKRPSLSDMLKALQKIREEGPPSIQLTAGNDVAYRKKTTVNAYRSKDAITIVKDWGKSCGQSGCYVILTGQDDVYLSDPDVFQKAYERVGNKGHQYRKSGTILARCMPQHFALKTNQGIEQGSPGDFVVQNDAGDQWVVEGHVFPTIYEEASV